MKTFSEWRKQTSLLTEALWNGVRPRLPKKQKKVTTEGRLLVLGDTTVDDSQQDVLRLGPKYCVEPQLDIVDRLALTRDVARYVPEKERDRCVVECVDVVAKASMRGKTGLNVRKTAKYLVDNNLRVVEADKEGMLVVLPDTMYLEKASMAVKKCFSETKINVKSVKRRAVELLEQSNQEKLAAEVKNTKGLKLDVFSQRRHISKVFRFGQLFLSGVHGK